MAYLRMKALRPRTPALIRSAFVDRAPADSDVSHGQFLLRPAAPTIIVVKHRHADPALKASEPRIRYAHRIPGRIRISYASLKA